MTMKRGAHLVILARQLIRELADAGFGVRETARVMGMSPSHVAYYRRALGLKVADTLTTEEMLATLPAEVQEDVRVYRAARAT